MLVPKSASCRFFFFCMTAIVSSPSSSLYTFGAASLRVVSSKAGLLGNDSGFRLRGGGSSLPQRHTVNSVLCNEGHSLRMFCTTWNVNGKPPSVPLEEWLLPGTEGDDMDIYVIGLQEVQDLTGTQALITDDEKGRVWSMSIQRALAAPSKHTLVAARQMVGVYLCVLVRSELAPHLKDLQVMELGTGFLQQGGNKGGVAASFTLRGAKICVVSAHLAAQTGNTERRNKDYRELVERLDFSQAEHPPVQPEDVFVLPPACPEETRDPALDVPAAKFSPVIKKNRSGVFSSGVHLSQLSSLWESAKKDAEAEKQVQPAQAVLGILNHDLVVWVGDLNYRFNLPEQAVLELIGERDWAMLREFDQLHIARKAGDSFHAFTEPPLSFAPTYKYERWGLNFQAKEEGQGLKRVPAWCDRVLFRPRRGVHVTTEAYRRHEVLGSDHRPVSALLHVAFPPTDQLAAARADDAADVPTPNASAPLQVSEADTVSSAPLESEAEGWAVLPDTQERGGTQPPQPVVSNLTASVALYDTRGEYILVSEGAGAGGGAALVVDKRGKTTRWVPAADAALQHKMSKSKGRRMVHGTLGLARLTYATYLVVVTKAAGVGALPQGSVHSVAETEVLPVSVGPPVPESAEEQRAVDDRQYGMLRDMLAGWNLFFSRDFDAAQTQQRLEQQESMTDQAAREQCGGRNGSFVWNAHMLELVGAGEGGADGRVLIPAVCGFFKEVETEVRGQRLRLALVSRRSRHRAGVRFHSRGIDGEGHVSNFVETEQVVMSEAGSSSFVLVRGSIPLFWQEGEALVTLKPAPTVVQGRPHREAMTTHLARLSALYGHVTMLSLIDTSGVEGPISQALKHTVAEVVPAERAPATLTEFDFHKQCGKSASPAAAVGVARLLDSMSDRLGPDNLFVRLEGRGRGRQRSVLRVNCIDCLDRTNVVQAAAAARMLVEQLQHHALLEPIEYQACMFAARNGYLPPLPLMGKVLRGLWADMGDAVSVQYAGTGALKGDFTRSGKRTVKGMLSDGIANVRRAVQNNFADVHRQQVLDMVHGAEGGQANAKGIMAQMQRAMPAAPPAVEEEEDEGGEEGEEGEGGVDWDDQGNGGWDEGGGWEGGGVQDSEE